MQVKEELLKRFTGTFKEVAPGIVGIRISRTKGGGYKMDQEAYIDVALARFNRTNKPTRYAPSRPQGITAEPLDGTEPIPVPTRQYLSLVSTIAYATHTNPEIVYTCNRLQRYSHAPMQHHYDAGIHCLDYLHGVS